MHTSPFPLIARLYMGQSHPRRRVTGGVARHHGRVAGICAGHHSRHHAGHIAGHSGWVSRHGHGRAGRVGERQRRGGSAGDGGLLREAQEVHAKALCRAREPVRGQIRRRVGQVHRLHATPSDTHMRTHARTHTQRARTRELKLGSEKRVTQVLKPRRRERGLNARLGTSPVTFHGGP